MLQMLSGSLGGREDRYHDTVQSEVQIMLLEPISLTEIQYKLLLDCLAYEAEETKGDHARDVRELVHIFRASGPR